MQTEQKRVVRTPGPWYYGHERDRREYLERSLNCLAHIMSSSHTSDYERRHVHMRIRFGHVTSLCPT